MKKNFLFSLFVFAVSACQNPTKSIEKDIQSLKDQKPPPFTHYQGSSHPMRFASTGDPMKRPILFVHGSPGSWEAWAHFLKSPELQKNYHLIAIDRPGFGESDKGNTELSLEVQARNIIGALEFNQSQLPAILVGHSYGGPVVARIAMDYPDQVAGIIFVASSVDPRLEETKWFQHVGAWWPFRNLIPTDLRVCNEEIFALRDELIKMLPLWNHIQAKAVILQGDKDDLVPKENADFLYEKINPDLIVKRTIIPGMNHFIPWREPQAIFDGIDALAIDFKTQRTNK